MVRLRNICTVKYGQFREFAAAMNKLNEECKANGWATSQFLVPVAGANNEFIAETDYADLATYSAENGAQMTDPDFMAVLRSTADMIYPQSSRSELLEDVPDLA
jgi:hypothetical protein